MAKSKATFGKKEKEIKRLKSRQNKEEKMAERKAGSEKGKSLDDMMAYVDENGNIVSAPTDPRKKREVNHELIQVSIPKAEERYADVNTTRTGTVSFFNAEKGFGFIKDAESGESIFVHSSQSTEELKEHMKVSFEVENSPKGVSAVRVKKA